MNEERWSVEYRSGTGTWHTSTSDEIFYSTRESALLAASSGHSRITSGCATTASPTNPSRNHHADACRHCGPTAISSPRWVAQPWRSSSAMSRISATFKQLRPYLPIAEARGFADAL